MLQEEYEASQEVVLSYFSVWERVPSEDGQVVGFWGAVRILDVTA